MNNLPAEMTEKDIPDAPDDHAPTLHDWSVWDSSGFQDAVDAAWEGEDIDFKMEIVLDTAIFPPSCPRVVAERMAKALEYQVKHMKPWVLRWERQFQEEFCNDAD